MVIRRPPGGTFTAALLALLSVAALCVLPAGGYIGVSYGSNFANPNASASPAAAALLLKNLGVKHVRLYGSDAGQVEAFAGSGLQIVISVQNSEVEGLGQSTVAATTWINNNVVRHITSGVNITAIAVGEEVFTRSDGSNAFNFVLSAMNNLYAALKNASLSSQVAISTPHSTAVLTNSFPPSMGAFNQTLLSLYLNPVLQFLADTRSYFMLNLQPFYLFQQGANAIPLNYCLFLPNVGVNDTITNLHYANVFDAVLDAVYAALGAANFSNLRVVVLKTGWPSRGDTTESGATVQNAQSYNQNLVTHVIKGGGTPARRGQEIQAFIYELFNEDGQQGAASNRNWGFFYPNQTAVYSIDLTGNGVVFNVTANRTWCIAKRSVGDQALLPGLNWACGQGEANCTAIQPGQPCYLPDTVFDHASYAYNDYYQKKLTASGTCDFGGTAVITTNDPSYPGCTYQSSVPDKRPSAGISSTQVSSHAAGLICLMLLLVISWGT